MRAFNRIKARGFTLVELMIVVAIIGVLAALAIYGVRKYLASAKSAEAKNTIGAIQRAAVAAYERENMPADLQINGGVSAGASHQLCGSSNPVPAADASIQNKKYTPLVNGDYQAPVVGKNDALNGWKCLRFELTEPQYYRYAYTQAAAAQIATTVTLPAGSQWMSEARGDLNGNGVFAEFLLSGAVNNGIPVTSTAISELNADE